MTVSNTNSTTMGNLYEDQFDDYIVSNWGNLNIASVPKFNLFETACEELKIKVTLLHWHHLLDILHMY